MTPVNIPASDVKRGDFPVTIFGDDVRRYVVTRIDTNAEPGLVWLMLRSPIGGHRVRWFRLAPHEEITVMR